MLENPAPRPQFRYGGPAGCPRHGTQGPGLDQARRFMASVVQSPVIQAPAVQAARASPAGRDLRLDLFRGLALWLIFLDHVPNNIVAWFTIRNYGFSDATEIFIFISGYTAAFVYGRAMIERGFIVAGARILQAGLADLRGARLPVRDLHRRDRLCRVELRESALRRGNERARLPQDAGRHDHPGAAAQVQAGQHGRAAALYRAADDVPGGALAADPQRHGRAGRFRSRSMC